MTEEIIHAGRIVRRTLSPVCGAANATLWSAGGPDANCPDCLNVIAAEEADDVMLEEVVDDVPSGE